MPATEGATNEILSTFPYLDEIVDKPTEGEASEILTLHVFHDFEKNFLVTIPVSLILVTSAFLKPS